MKQVWRDKDTAIYAYPGGYEVIVVKKAPAEFKFGKNYPAREVYPGNEEWGRLAATRPGSDSMPELKARAKALFEDRPGKARRASEGRL